MLQRGEAQRGVVALQHHLAAHVRPHHRVQQRRAWGLAPRPGRWAEGKAAPALLSVFMRDYKKRMLTSTDEEACANDMKPNPANQQSRHVDERKLSRKKKLRAGGGGPTGKASRIASVRKAPTPDPVPPAREWSSSSPPTPSARSASRSGRFPRQALRLPPSTGAKLEPASLNLSSKPNTVTRWRSPTSCGGP